MFSQISRQVTPHLHQLKYDIAKTTQVLPLACRLQAKTKWTTGCSPFSFPETHLFSSLIYCSQENLKGLAWWSIKVCDFTVCSLLRYQFRNLPSVIYPFGASPGLPGRWCAPVLVDVHKLAQTPGLQKNYCFWEIIVTHFPTHGKEILKSQH